MGEIFNALIEFFEEDEWDFQWMEGLSVLSLGFGGKSGRWTCYAQARERQEQFVFYSVLPVLVPPERRHIVAEFITRANYGMVIGNFELDFNDGELRYKTSIDVDGASLIPPLIRQVVYANVIITDRYYNGLMQCIYSDHPIPTEIIAGIEGSDSQSEARSEELMNAVETLLDQFPQASDANDDDDDDELDGPEMEIEIYDDFADDDDFDDEEDFADDDAADEPDDENGDESPDTGAASNGRGPH